MEKIRDSVRDLGLLLQSKEKEVFDLFSAEELKDYFRCRDSVKSLIVALYSLEISLYKHKIVL